MSFEITSDMESSELIATAWSAWFEILKIDETHSLDNFQEERVVESLKMHDADNPKNPLFLVSAEELYDNCLYTECSTSLKYFQPFH